MIHYEESNGIACVIWDMDGPQNVLSLESHEAYSNAVNKALNDKSVSGVIITSG